MPVLKLNFSSIFLSPHVQRALFIKEVLVSENFRRMGLYNESEENVKITSTCLAGLVNQRN